MIEMRVEAPPVAVKRTGKKRKAVTAKGKPTVTRFQVLERLELHLGRVATGAGRTHQKFGCTWPILVTPWLEIPAYGPKDIKDKGTWLHARTLGFTILGFEPWNLQQKCQRSLRKRWKTFERIMKNS